MNDKYDRMLADADAAAEISEATARKNRISDKDLKEAHQRIDETVRLRSAALHQGDRIRAAELDDQLIGLMALLPDNRPEYPMYLYFGKPNAWGIWPDEQIKQLQGVWGDHATYIPKQEWRIERWYYKPTDRVKRLQIERSKSREVLQQIQQFEALGIVASEAGDVERSHPVGVQGEQPEKVKPRKV